MKWLPTLFALVGLVTLAQPTRADDRIDSLTDEQFVAKAATCGSTEVELGKWAVRNSQNPQVKAFGQHLVDDHSRANQELLTMAGRKQISVPKKVEPKQQEEVNRLAKLQGAEFDREFAERTIKDHKEAVEMFEHQSEKGKDPELKAYAARLLPTLRDHLRMARALKGENNDGSKSTER